MWDRRRLDETFDSTSSSSSSSSSPGDPHSPGAVRDIEASALLGDGMGAGIAATVDGAPDVAARDSLGVKESEKIIDDLRKENFNLKLRIFFLEEEFRTNGASPTRSPLSAPRGMEDSSMELGIPMHSIVESVAQLANECKNLRTELESSHAHARDLQESLDNAAASSNETLEYLADGLPVPAHQSPNPSSALGKVISRIHGLEEERDELLKELESSLEMLEEREKQKNDSSSGEETFRRLLEDALNGEAVAASKRPMHPTLGSELSKVARMRLESEDMSERITGLETMLNDAETDLKKNYVRKADVHVQILKPAFSKINELTQQHQDALHSIQLLQSDSNIHSKVNTEELDQLEKELEISKKQLSDTHTSSLELKEKLAESLSLNEELNTKLSNLELEKTDLAQRELELERQVEESLNAVDSLSDVEDYERQIQAYIAENDSLKHQLYSASVETEASKHVDGGVDGTEISFYKRQICDFERLSQVASKEIAALQSELDAQTDQLRTIEERMRDGAVNPTPASKRRGSGGSDAWQSIIESERNNWKSAETSLKSRLRSFEEEMELLQSLLHEKNRELQRVREASASKSHGDIDQVQREVSTAAGERDLLLQKISPQLQATSSLAQLADINNNLKVEMTRLQEQLTEKSVELVSLRERYKSASNEVREARTELASMAEENRILSQNIREQRNAQRDASQREDYLQSLELSVKKLRDELQRKREELHDARRDKDNLALEFRSFMNRELELVARSFGENTPLFERLEDGQKSLSDYVERLCSTRSHFLSQFQEFQKALSAESKKWSEKYDSILLRLGYFSNVVKKAIRVQRELKAEAQSMRERLKTEKATTHRLRRELDRAATAVEKRDAAARDAIQSLKLRVRDAEDRAATAEGRAAEAEKDLATVQERVARDRARAAGRADELTEQIRFLQTQLDKTEKLKSQAISPDDQGRILAANEQLRQDFHDARRLLDR
ncbi:hypothetical protein HK405_006482, partial [Cladochytrium tenue]